MWVVRVGFGRFEHGPASLHHVCEHKEVVFTHVRILQVMHRLYSFLTAAGIIKRIILMQIVIQKGLCSYETRVNEIELYSSFKCASDYM